MSESVIKHLLSALDAAGHGLQADLDNDDKETINDIFDDIYAALGMLMPHDEYQKITLVTPYLIEEDDE